MYGLRMTRIAQRMISPRGRSASAQVRRTRPRIEALEARLVLSSSGNNLYLQTNLVSDIQGMAQAYDPNLKDPWGLSFSTGSPFWVSDQASNLNGSSSHRKLFYRVNALQQQRAAPCRLIVKSRTRTTQPADAATNGPTGQVSTGAGNHHKLERFPGRRPERRSHTRPASSSRTWTVRSRRGPEGIVVTRSPTPRRRSRRTLRAPRSQGWRSRITPQPP